MLQKTARKHWEQWLFVYDKVCRGKRLFTGFSSELFILFSLVKFQMAFKTFDPAASEQRNVRKTHCRVTEGEKEWNAWWRTPEHTAAIEKLSQGHPPSAETFLYREHDTKTRSDNVDTLSMTHIILREETSLAVNKARYLHGRTQQNVTNISCSNFP